MHLAVKIYKYKIMKTPNMNLTTKHAGCGEEQICVRMKKGIRKQNPHLLLSIYNIYNIKYDEIVV